MYLRLIFPFFVAKFSHVIKLQSFRGDFQVERLRELDHPHICKTLDAFEDGRMGHLTRFNQLIQNRCCLDGFWASHWHHPFSIGFSRFS